MYKILAILFLLPALLNAQNSILVGYDFTNNSLSATTSHSLTTATDITSGSWGTGLLTPVTTANATTDGLDAEGNSFGSTNAFALGGTRDEFAFNDTDNANDLKSAITGFEYFTFTVTPDMHRTLNLSNISFRAFAQNANNSANRWAIFSSVDGFYYGSEIATGQITDLNSWTGTSNNITVDLSDAKYQGVDEVTFRMYVYGGNENASSVTAFDQIVVKGEVAESNEDVYAINSSGRNSHFWMTLKPLAGTNQASNDDLILTNGYRTVNLSSPYLTCNRAQSGNSWIYTIQWDGNDLTADQSANSLEFNVVVDAYEGATYVYSADAGASSVTNIGSASVPSGSQNGWGVDDADVDEGQTLQFSTSDFKIDGAALSNQNIIVVDDQFVNLTAREPNAGHSHKMIYGVGNNLNSNTFGATTDLQTIGTESFSITGAGSNQTTREWTIDNVKFSFILRNTDLDTEDLTNFWSDFESGAEKSDVEIQPTSAARLAHFPKFSWDRVSRSMLIRHSTAGYSDAQIKRMAEMCDIIVLEKANGDYEGYMSISERLKEVNPDIKVMYYWNSRIYFGNNGIDESINDHWDEYIHPTYKIRETLNTINRDNIDAMKWWWGVMYKVMGIQDLVPQEADEPRFHSSGRAFSPSPIDGVFIDKKGYPGSMYEPFYPTLPDYKLTMCNNGDDRERINFQDGIYREGWKHELDETILLNQECGVKKKFTLLRHTMPGQTTARDYEDALDYELAIHLTYVDEYAYFFYFGTVDAKNDEVHWLTDYQDQFHRPLGEPYGMAIKDGNVYARSFEHCDLYSELNAEANGLDHYRILWKNNIGNPSVAGDGYVNTSYEYNLKGSGSISGANDKFFFLSDLHYGDGEVSGKVEFTNGVSSSRAGVMFRARNEFNSRYDKIDAYANGDVLTANDQMVALMKSPEGITYMYAREQKGGNVQEIAKAPASMGSYTKIIRSGDGYTGYVSVNGQTWTAIGSVKIAMGDRTESGMAITSGDDATLAEATIFEYAREETTHVTSMTDITADGVSLPEFDSEVLFYNIELPEGTTAIPNVMGIANVNVTKSQEGDLANGIFVKLQPEDSRLTYTVKISIEQPTCVNTTALIQAECYGDMSGIVLYNSTDIDGTEFIGNIQAGDWTMYEGIDLTGMKSVEFRVATKVAVGNIEIHTGSVDGPVIAETSWPNTGGWQNWETVAVNIIETSGTQDLYVVFTGTVNVNWFGFSEETVSDIQTIELKEGWNLVSLYIDPDNRQTGTVFPNATIVKTFDAFYSSSQADFLNTLTAIEAGVGYLVYNSIDETITITGVETHGHMSLQEGWNLIGVPSSTPLPLSTYPDAKIIKDFDGFYEEGNDLNSLSELKPGKAYFIKR